MWHSSKFQSLPAHGRQKPTYHSRLACTVFIAPLFLCSISQKKIQPFIFCISSTLMFSKCAKSFPENINLIKNIIFVSQLLNPHFSLYQTTLFITAWVSEICLALTSFLLLPSHYLDHYIILRINTAAPNTYLP